MTTFSQEERKALIKLHKLSPTFTSFVYSLFKEEMKSFFDNKKLSIHNVIGAFYPLKEKIIFPFKHEAETILFSHKITPLSAINILKDTSFLSLQKGNDITEHFLTNQLAKLVFLSLMDSLSVQLKDEKDELYSFNEFESEVFFTYRAITNIES